MAWWSVNKRAFPWRDETDSFRTLVTEVLLQRSRASTVSAIYPRFFKRWPTARALDEADEEEIIEVIKPLGLTGRSKRLKRLASELVVMGAIPRTAVQLQALPGVGRYAALATLGVLDHTTDSTVDTVSVRVYARYVGRHRMPSPASPVLEKQVAKLTKGVTQPDINWAVLDLAASVCLPKKPRCAICPLASGCKWAYKTAESALQPEYSST
jgi:A/G-specific adenine glycosylase